MKIQTREEANWEGWQEETRKENEDTQMEVDEWELSGRYSICFSWLLCSTF